jgi:membrane fusion protein (multidrug efflux system)
MIKRLVIVIALIAVVCGLILYANEIFFPKMIAGFFSRGRPPSTVTAATVASSQWQPGIAALGTAKAGQGVDVAVEVAGVVKAITFKANDRVNGGQLLVQIDDAVERADMAALQANLRRDEAQLERQRTLRDRGVVAEANIDVQQAALESSRSALQRLRANLDRKAVHAPFSGVIGIPQINLGQFAQAGQVIATLQDLDRIKVDFTVPEQFISKLAIGQSVRVGLDAANLNGDGRITGIEPKIDPASRLVTARAELDNRTLGIRPGQFVHVRIELPAEDNVVTVLQTAVIASLYGDYVYVVTEGEQANEQGQKPLIAKQVFVKTGRRNGNQVEIVEGLKPGQQIVTSGQNKLDSGAPIIINNSVDPANLTLQNRQAAR